MKTIKHLASALTVALFALVSPLVASAANGHIFDIRPCDEFGTIVSSPVASADAPLGGGEKVNFLVRMAKADNSSASTKWRLKHIGLNSEAVDAALNPFGIGIYVSGEIRIATLKSVLSTGEYFSDFVFEYVTKPGDFALPIVLASSNGKPASDGAVEDLAYFINPAAAGVWSIVDEMGAPANFWFGNNIGYATGYESDRKFDCSLRGAGFYVKTIDFDSNFEDFANGIWRTVHKNSTITGGTTPSIEVTGMPTNAITLYIWSMHEIGVKLANGTERDIHVEHDKTEKRTVYEAKIVAGKLQYPFEIYGLAKDQTDYLVLSAYPDFNYYEGTGARYNDYLTVKVKGTEELPPSIRVAPTLGLVTATSDYTHYATELNITLTQAYTEDIKVTITPSFENGNTEANWGDYIRFSDAQDLTSLPEAVAPVVTIKAGSLVPETKLFIFALRSDANTVGVANHIQFTATTDNAGAQDAIDDWGVKQGDLNINAQNPVIRTPVEGDNSLTAVAGAKRTLRITVDDTYADMASGKGYEIYVLKNSDTESSFTKLEGAYKPGQGGFLYKVGETDVLPSVVYSETGVNKTTIYVKSPVSGNQSEERNFTCTVSAPAGFTVTAIDGKTNNEYLEGDDVTIEIKLDRQNTTGGSLYAFLKPVTDKDKNAVDCSFIAQDGGYGLEIPQYGESVVGFFKLADGGTGAANSQFSYKVELRTARGYNDTGATTVSSFMCKNTLGIKSTNVIPSVDSVMMGLNETNDEGKFDGIVVAKGVEQTFKANVSEPGQYDLDADGEEAFQTRWIFKTTGFSPSGPTNGQGENNSIIYGNPEDNGAKFTFNRAGKWEVTVELRDKDMGNWGNGVLKGKYTFYVDVVDQPAITITGRTETGDETVSFYEVEAADAGGSAYIDVNLAMNKCDFDLKVEVAIASGDPSSSTPGKFVLLESTNVKKKVGEENVYVFTFPAGETTVPAIIKTLDGTVTSRTQGFVLTPVMLPDDANRVVPESGEKTPDQYYVGTQKTIKVNNSVPSVDEADLYPAPGTTNFVAIGAADPITWNFTDVQPDFEGGIAVTVKGGGGFTETVTTQAGAAGTFTPNFSSSGPQSVTLTIKDKDNGQISYTWYYEVEVAKTLTVIAHGPATGNGTANSKRYRTAAGLGEGRVWANSLSNIEGFKSFFNCGKSADWTVYGAGYSVGYEDKTIDAQGNQSVTGSYFYPSIKDKYGFEVDSFLYAWLQIIKSEEGGSLTDQLFGESTSPEYKAASANSGTLVGLPSEQNDDGSYQNTMLEAIFSREYLATDNMGDINQDGIPDIYVDKYGMGVVDPVSGKVVGDDLSSLVGYNEDLDFMPANPGHGYGTLIPGLEESWVGSGIPFKAVTEIRGYGEGLNNAPALAGIPNAKPDRVYTNPNDDAKSTLTYVEYLAWTEFAAANGLDAADSNAWANWSPERPTDPTKIDTDEDGFSDGYEYYFWYRAFVGFLDADGNHRYLTGRAYDPRNPGEGRRISSAEIAALMDPITPSGDESSASTRDTDNDGLPDLLEYLIGTNPFDFDTDGDGLADGWELMIAGTSPVLASSHLDAMLDTLRNYDGDAMAITSPQREKAERPAPLYVKQLTSFAVVDKNGDSDGLQWYVVSESDAASVTFELETQTGTLLVAADGTKYIVADGVNVKATDDKRLAMSIAAYEVANAADEVVASAVPGITVDYLRLKPVMLEAGLNLAEAPAAGMGTEYAVAKLATVPEDGKCNAAWVYGNPSLEDYGFLALARYALPEVGAELCAVPTIEREVAYLHSLVYQEFGFDPRTAWSDKSPMAARWGKTSSDGEAVEGVTVLKQGGYASTAARTRAYAMYDEFLVYSFFLNNGTDMSGTTYVSATAPQLAQIWGAFTTNPQGPGEPGVVSEDNYYGRNSEEGADTDLDGVPDGWELYVMAGPKTKEGKFVFAPAWAGFATALSTDSTGTYVTSASHWSPFVADADKNVTDSQLYLGGSANSDGLNQRREFGGTDSCAHYAECSTTIVRHESDLRWLNKFFPTDPWAADTDGDGINDNAEGSAFVYGSPVDNGKLWSIPGGGLNPCSVDTDLDGLPDPWENQYKGKTVYSGEDAHYASGLTAEKGNPLEGYVDGMDATVPDAYTVPNNVTVTEPDGRMMIGTVNRDYDRDGLENWQEYITGTMRCWRYDDPFSPWTAIPESSYFTENEEGELVFDLDTAVATFGCATADEFWFKTLVDKQSGIYNPNFVTDCSAGWQYFSRVTNVWDTAYLDNDLGGTSGAYYFFYNRVNNEMIKDAWPEILGLETGDVAAPIKYMGCSPLKADSDQDGMDDYYELFHGMNPLLGESGVAISSNGPCDLVADAWTAKGKASVQAWSDDLQANYWTKQVKAGNFYRTGVAPKGNGYDFEYYPWLNGLATADPDGDDLRNQQEAIMPTVNINAKHTDPTPLWMTDSSYSNSFVRMFFRMPTRFTDVTLNADSFKNPDDETQEYFFRDFAGFVPAKDMDPAKFVGFSPDMWQLAADGEENWMFSFEENEGYDTDHDGVSDSDEGVARFREATDALDADSPRRRQAMYFGGKDQPSILQTLPFEKERHPVATKGYPENTDFCQFTVECWVKAESLDDATVVERATRVVQSNPGDEKYVRRNFHLGIRNGKWYAAYDSAGTLTASTVEAIGFDATTEWTHLAATYNGKEFKFYINGVNAANTLTSVDPEYGVSALALRDVSIFWGTRNYDLVATILGASIKSGDDGKYGDALALNSAAAVKFTGLSAYENFFKGWIDEVRIWDGARTSDEVAETFKVRFTVAEALANREAVFNEWKEGNRRYVAGNTARAELRYHYAFDSVFGAMTSAESDLRRTPQGFTDNALGKATLSRPDDWFIAWFKPVLDAHGSAYASDLWAVWIHNTVTHLPRLDGTTLDSFYWSKDFEGWKIGGYNFPLSAEPYSKWTQMVYNQALTSGSGDFGCYATPGARYQLLYGNPDAQGFEVSSNETFAVDYKTRFEFTGRYLNQQGDDMLPLGGAFAKYVDTMWDDNGASSPWEYTGIDPTLDGIPEWWQEHAFENYDSANEYNDASQITWDTIVERGGQKMTAREAYWRDLAAGMMLENGKVVVKDNFEQIADVNGDGLADWWQSLFGVANAKIADDSDNDGLADYAEYLVAETFKFANVNPMMPCTDGKRLDYFGKIGSLYFGEVLSDHDFMEDWWESIYDLKYVSAGVYDAHADGDKDGWSNYAECRFGSSPARISYLGVDSATMNDFPIPVVKLTCSYKGAQNASVYPVVVKAYSKKNDSMMPDAVWTIASAADSGEDGGENTEADKESDKAALRTKHLGMNSGANVTFNLGPGSIVMGSLVLELKDLTWESGYFSLNDDGSKNIISSEIGEASKSTWTRQAFDQVRVGDTVYGDIVDIGTSTRNIIGVINYQTGEITIDLSKLAGTRYYNVYQLTDANGNLINRYYYYGLQAEESFIRIQYTSEQTTTGYPKTFYLADADLNSAIKPSNGHLYEGENWFEAFVDMDGDGQYSAGEPYGFKRGVDIGWSGTEFDIELTDTSPVFARLRFDGENCTCDRVAIHGTEADVLVRNNSGIFSSGGIEDRVRIVRTKVNGIEISAAGLVVVADRKIQLAVRPYITEADILGDTNLDVEALGSMSLYQSKPIKEIAYGVVFGDADLTSSLSGNRAAPYEIIRRFDANSAPVKPTIVTDGKLTVFNAASPTFVWNMGGDDTYSAFEIQVRDTNGKVVYDSGFRLVPGKDDNGNYSWTPDDLFVDDLCSNGAGVSMFENMKQYTWRVQMGNVKFGNKGDGWSVDSPEFRMNVNVASEVNDSGYSCIKACVKYFGPSEVYANVEDVASVQDKIRVEAFASPDFTGTPVARGIFVADKAVLANDNYEANVVLKGIPSGTYYLRAYIDNNGNFKRDSFESWGYSSRRDKTSGKNIFTPVPVTVGPSVAVAPLARIYIEDVDTDGDWLPDAWEWVTSNGDLTVKGPGAFFDQNVFGFAEDFQKRFTRVSASGKPLANNLMALSSDSIASTDMTALLLGVNTSGYNSSAEALSAWIAPELVENGVSIESLAIAGGKVAIKVASKTSPAAATSANSSFYTYQISDTLVVTCNVYVKENLATDEWKLAKSERIVAGGEAVEIDVGNASGASGFYKVELVR